MTFDTDGHGVQFHPGVSLPRLYYFDDQSMTTWMDVGLRSDFLALIEQSIVGCALRLLI